jgi:ribosome-binding factor A
VREVLADLVTRRVKDPDLLDALFSFTNVEVSPDLGHAKVFVSVMGDEEQKGVIIEALRRSEPYLHREMGRQLHIKRVPHLRFHLDESMEEADRLTAMMREIARSEGREL